MASENAQTQGKDETRVSGLSPRSFRPRWADLLAGFINAVMCVPNGLAMGALAGVPPMNGLYAAMLGSGLGSLFTSTHLMIITTTSAAAVTAGQTVSAYSAADRPGAIFLLALLTGILLVLFGFLKVGRLIRFVPYSVMQGFLFSIALVLVLGQLPDMVGYAPASRNTVIALVETFGAIPSWEWQATVVGVLTLLILVVTSRTRIGPWSNLAALALPTVLMVALGWSRLEQVVDVSPIPRGFPPFSFPHLDLLTTDMFLGAVALAAITIVQSVGITESIRNYDRSEQSSSTDIVAQGFANVAGGLFSAIPVGASVGQTALNRSTGGRTRWTNIFCSLWLLVFVFVLAGVIELVPMAVLAGLMVYAGIGAMAFGRAQSIFRTGPIPAVVFCATLVIAVMVSVPAAVLLGLVLALVMNMIQSSRDFTVREVTVDDQGHMVEGAVPKELPGQEITLLNLYGDLFFAAAKQLQQQLPEVGSGERPVLIIRFRGQHDVGSTLVDVLTDYAKQLSDVRGRLYLAGVERNALTQFERAGRIPLDDVVFLIPATDQMGKATLTALKHAHRWLAEGEDYEGSRAGVYDVKAVHLIEPGDADPHITGPIDTVPPEMLRRRGATDQPGDPEQSRS